MAQGSIVKRCPICRGKKKIPEHKCSPHEVSYHIVYWQGGKQKWEYAGRVKRDAEELLEKRLSEIREGTYHARKKTLFKDFSAVWLKNRVDGRVKETTQDGYESDVRVHLIPFWGQFFLDKIRQEDVEEFLSQLKEKNGRGRNKCEKKFDLKTVNNIRLTLNIILKYAWQLKYISVNPVEYVPPYKVERKEMDYLQLNEIGLLLKHAREPYKTLFLTAILTGMRRAELAAFQWGDIDWNRNTISVKRSLYWCKKKNVPDGEKRWKFVTPKSKSSIRALFMSPKLKEALEIHRISFPTGVCDLVFCNTDGNPMDEDNMVKREFLPTLSMAGIRRIRFHDLRHTYASILIAQGESPKFIQMQMGHASIITTMDTYGHLFPVNNAAVGQKTDELVFGVPSNNGLTTLGQEPQSIAKDAGANLTYV